MKTLKLLVTLTVLVLAFGAALFTQRITILELFSSVTMPELPEAVSFEEVAVEPGEIIDDVVEDVEVVIEDEVDVVEEVEDDVVGDLIEDPAEEGEVVEEVVETLPISMNLAVPFTPQAPNADWSYPYKEACEEASLYMVHRYFEGEPAGLIESSKADADLLEMVEFEEGLFGYSEDTTVEQTAVLAELIYGREVEILVDPTVEDIKMHIAQGRPVIVPAAGRLLGNKYFTAPGPVYHMLVIRGYTASNQFIVNDPGTSRGEAFVYDVDTIMYAMHDWNNGDEITDGKKTVLVLYP